MKTAAVPDAEAERLRVLQELQVLDTEVDPAFAAIARLAAEHSGWPMAAVNLVDAERQWASATVGLPVGDTPRELAFCAHAILGAEPLEVPDASVDERFADNPLVTGVPHVRAYAAAPVTVGGQRVGTVCVVDRRANRLDARGLAALCDLAALASALLDARLREQRARLQEVRVRDASRAGSDWLWESNAEGLMTWVSDSVEAHTGQPASNDTGRDGAGLHQPRDDYRDSWVAYRRARAAHQPFQDAVADRDTARGRITVSFSGNPVFDERGRFQGYRGAARNITQEIALRARAQQAQQLLRDALEQVNAAIMISAADGRIVFANAIWRRNVAPFVRGEPETWEALLREMVASGAYPDASGREEEFIRWRLGAVDREQPQQELRFGTHHYQLADQRLSDGSVMHLSVDITAHKLSELKLREQESELRATGERMRAVLQSVPDLWFVVDAEARYLECSDEQHPWLVHPFAALRGRRFADVLPPALAAEGERLIAEALRSDRVQHHEYGTALADGSRREFEARISPMPGDRALYLLRDLTELRGLARHVQLLERALEAEAALPMTIVDATQPDAPMIYVNQAFERLTGYTRDEMLGRNCRLLQGGAPPQPEPLALLRAALAEGRACSVVLDNRRKDGSAFVNELHVAPVHDEQGRLTHYIGVQHDITERSRAAAQLALSESLYRSVTAAVTDSLLVVGPDGMIITANPAACELLRIAPEQLRGQRLSALGFRTEHEDGRPLGDAEHPVRQVLASGRSLRDQQLRLACPDGRRLLLRLSVQPLAGAVAGARPGCVITCSDVTAQRAAERALAQAEARWGFALDGAGYGVWDHDEDTEVTFFSPRWKQMLGYADNEVGNSLKEWTHRIHPEDHARVIAEIGRYRRGETEAYETQHRLRHKKGHWIWVLDRGKIVERRADGSPRRVVGTHSDITRQRLADQALRDKQAVELASRAKSEFLSRMSHEMRTPLNAVIGFTQLLRLHGAQDRVRLAQYTEHILTAGQHLLALVNDVLDLQQVEEGRLALQLEPVALQEAVDGALELIRPLALTRAVALHGEVPAGAVAQADAQRLRQVLLNVLSNGVKYNREGGMLRCRFEPAGAGRGALLVQDSGPGLEAAQVARLFQPFERLGLETSTIEGTGLGLIIARRLMQEMGGELRLTSEPGRGTTVRLELELSAAAAPPHRAPAAPAPAEAEAPAAPAPLRMLYVEDNRINAILFEEAIKLRGGVELRVAEDGAEALALVGGDWSPDVLVLDANLPGMSGYEVLEQLRALPALAAAPAFMCSADAMPGDVQRARDAGFAGYWTKPIDLARVMRDLDTLRPPPPR